MKPANPMLSIIVYEAAAKEESRSAAVLYAAVHAWFEGHIAGEGDRKAARKKTDESLPMPPFPESDSALLQDIIKNANELFTSEELTPAAASYAAGLAWAAGFAEGKRCPGCSYRGENPEKAAEIREGRVPAVLMNGVATNRVFPLAGDDERIESRHGEIGRRLAAAWISYQTGRTGVDYTLKQTKDRIGAYWQYLALHVERDMFENLDDMWAGIGGDADPEPGDSQ